MRIHTLLIGQPQTMTDEHGTWRSAIFRAPVSEAIQLDYRGLAGDQVADTKNHGSLDQAVSCYPLRHYAEWNAEYAPDAPLGPGSVGENWTLADMSESDVCIGDIYTVGSARVQVSQPRYPCIKQERKVRLAGFLQRVMETLRTGFYLRVLTPGVVQAGSELVLEARPQPDLSVQRLNVDIHHVSDPEFEMSLLNAPELSAGWKRILRIWLARQKTR
jgi:MOSC domain-containing protein YiiM